MNNFRRSQKENWEKTPVNKKKQISNCYLRMDPDLISQLSNHYQNCTGRGIVLNLMWYFWGVPKKWNE